MIQVSLPRVSISVPKDRKLGWKPGSRMVALEHPAGPDRHILLVPSNGLWFMK